MRTLFPLLVLSPLILSPLSRAVTADGAMWNATAVGEVGYLPLEDLRSFYKFMPLPPSIPGTHAMGNGTMSLVFGPAPRELRIRGVRCQLTYPVQSDPSQGLLVSKADMVKLIDPVLRPTYIADRREVKTIVIDPAHGGHDTGKVTPQVREADTTLQVANKLRAELVKRGFRVVLTHDSNQYLSDQQRIDLANKEENAIFLSLHLNSGRSDISGIETYSAAPAAPDERAMPGNAHDSANAALAVALQSALVAGSGAADGGFRRARYSILSSLNCPAVLIELGYATHAEEAARLATDEYQTRLALALAEGVSTFATVMNPANTLPTAPKPAVVEAPPTPAKVEAAKPAIKQKAKSKNSKQRAKSSPKRPARERSKVPASSRSRRK